jgi:hypothetical protein
MGNTSRYQNSKGLLSASLFHRNEPLETEPEPYTLEGKILSKVLVRISHAISAG